MSDGIVQGTLKVRTELIFETAPGIWFLLAALLAGLFLVYQYRRLRAKAPGPALWLLMGTRVLLLSALLCLLLKPTILKRKLAPLASRLTVLVDTSRSMGLPWNAGESRLAAARRLVGRLVDRSRESGDGVELLTFDEEARPVTPAELAAAIPQGRKTDLGGALAAAAARTTPGSRILMLTDGRHNGGDVDVPSGGRMVLVGIGNRQPFRDLRVDDLKVADLGFQGKPLEVAATVRGTGYDAMTVPLSLKVDGRLITVQDATVPAGGEATVRFAWTPRETGTFQVSVAAKPLPDEQVADNNLREAAVRVVRDRIRVLFISGSPTWNYRFLREALKRDPSLDLISFIILRSPADVVDAPQNELSLIPFPTEKLFTQELPGFDLVIFDNFPYQLYMPSQYLENLRKRVLEGGSFWMWGGALSFINGDYRGTPVEDLLPFTLEGPPPGEGYLEQKFRARLTPAAESGPLFGIAAPGVVATRWQDLPPLAGFNLVGPAREGAVVLAEHPDHLAGGKPQPLIALRNYGKGRVMAVATDSLWAWGFQAAEGGAGNRIYLEFVRNAVRWLTGDPILSPVRLSVTPEHPAAGETVTVRARVLDANYHPVTGAALDLSAIGPEGEKVNLNARPTGEEGIYTAEFRVPREGSWRFALEAAGPGGKLGEARTLLSAVGFQDELAAPSLDEGRLRSMAQAAGGTYLAFTDDRSFDEALGKALAPGDEALRLVSEERIGLGSLPLAFVLLLAVLGLDWTMRKRYRLE